MYKLETRAIADFRETQKSYNKWSSGLVFPDKVLMICIGILMLIGLVMVASASMPKAAKMGWVYHYSARQLVYMIIGLIVAFVVYNVSVRWWFNNSFKMLGLAIVLLVAVLIPGIGREINGAMRWVPLGMINIQVSEFARICIIIYSAAYLQRHQNSIRKSLLAMLKLLFVLGVISVLLLLEPDFGSTAVIGATVLGMIFLAGVCIARFTLCTFFVVIAAIVVLIAAPYRRARLSIYLDPWDDPFDKGYQLVQSLMAIGRGQVFGVGIGESIQKHNYLPEAHTDFILSILAEETGLIGVLFLMFIYAVIVWRAFKIARNADEIRMRFASCLAYGIGLWIGMQALINMSVASGLLPTKGLTLPMISYGGSSVLASLVLFAILLRIDSESRYLLQNKKLRQKNG